MAVDNKLGVLLKVGLSDDMTQIKKDLERIQQNLSKETINLKARVANASDASNEGAKSQANDNKELGASFDGLADKITKVTNAKGELVKETREYQASVDTNIKKIHYQEDATRDYNITLDQTIKNRKRIKELLNDSGLSQEMKQKMLATNATEKQVKAQITLNTTIETFTQKLKMAKIASADISKRGMAFGTAEQRTELIKYNNEIQKLTTNQNMSQKELKQTSNKLEELQAHLNATSKQARLLGNNSMTMGKMLKTAFEKFAVWMTATTVFFGVQRALRAGVKIVHELDDALVELAKVTDLNSSELDTMARSAFKVADSIGSVGIEVVKATADFARMGFAANQALGLAEKAIVLKNIGDGIDTVEMATTTLISTLKGFRMEATEATRVIDSLNEVSNKYAVNTVDLASGLKNASATMAQTGTSLEETLAILAAGNEIIQNMSKTSTGLVTISQRLRGLSEAAEEGEDFTNFTAKLQDAFKSIANVDVMVGGKLRSTYDILVDMAKAQETLSAEQMQYLGEMAAGKRQVKIWNSFLQNSETLLTAKTAALESDGSAMRENAKVLDSITGKTNLFTNAAQKMWSNTISSGFVKWLVDAGTALIKFADAVGLVNIAFTILATVISIKMFTVGTFSTLGASAATLAIKLGLAQTAAIGLGAALSIIAPVAIVAGVILLIKAIDKLHKTQEDYNELLAESGMELQETQNELADYQSRIEELTEAELKYMEILKLRSKAQRDANKALEEEKYAKLVESVGKRTSYKGGGYSEDALALQKYKDALGSLGKMFGTTTAEVYALKIALIDEYKEFIIARDEYGHTSDALSDYITTTEELLGILPVVVDSMADVNFELGEQKSELEYITEAMEVYGLTSDQAYKNYLRYVEVYEYAAGAVAKVAMEQEDYDKLIGESTESIDNFQSSMSSLSDIYEEISDEQEVSKSTMLDLIQQYPQLTNEILNMNSSKEAGMSVTAAMFELEKQKTIGILTLLQEENRVRMAGYKIQRDALGMYDMDGSEPWRTQGSYEQKRAYSAANSQYLEMRTNINNASAAIDIINGLTIENIKVNKKSDKANKKSGKEKEEYISSQTIMNKLLNEYVLIQGKIAIGQDLYGDQIKKIKEIQSELHRLNNTDRDRLLTLKENTEEYDETLQDVNDRSEEWLQWQVKLIAINKELANVLKQDNIESLQNYMAELEESQKSLNGLIDKTVDLIKKENELYKEQLSDRKESLSLAKDELDLQKELKEANEDKSKLEFKLVQLKLDTSQNNQSRILEVEEQLAVKSLEIQDKLSKEAYDKKIQALDDEIESVDDYLSKEGILREDAMNRINVAFTSGNKKLFDDLILFNNVYGNSIESDVVNMWNSAETALRKYGDALQAIDIMSSMDTMSDKLIRTQMSLNSANWGDASKEGRTALHDDNVRLNRLLTNPMDYNAPTGEWRKSNSTSPVINKGFSMPAINSPSGSSVFNSTSPTSSLSIANLVTVEGSIDKDFDISSLVNKIISEVANITNVKGFNSISTM